MKTEKPKGKVEKTNVCGGFERMFEMMSRCCKGGENLPDCSSMMSLMEKCCRPQTKKEAKEVTAEPRGMKYPKNYDNLHRLHNAFIQ